MRKTAKEIAEGLLKQDESQVSVVSHKFGGANISLWNLTVNDLGELLGFQMGDQAAEKSCCWKNRHKILKSERFLFEYRL